MSVVMNETERIEHIKKSLDSMKIYLDTLAEFEPKKAMLISYWLQDYAKFLAFEDKFNPKKLKRYERGDIIKAHLGFNIGSELGGLHYCIVVEGDNAASNPVLTVVPLTSLKESQDPTQLKRGCIYLGNELYIAMNVKVKTLLDEINSNIANLRKQLQSYKESGCISEELLEHLEVQIQEQIHKKAEMDKTKQELSKMKQGSIALVNQITTISKIRIYNPKRNHDALAHIRVSNEKLDLIDKAILQLFTKC